VNWLNTCIFLSGVDDAEDGGTMVCSGSHRLDVAHESAAGDPPAAVNGKAAAGSVPDWRACLAAREQIRCPARSVLHFTESLLHAGNAVLSEQTRYAMFFEVVAPGTDRRAGWRPSFIEHPWGLTSPLRSPRTRPGAADQRPAFLGLFGPYRAHTREAREILPGLWQGPEEFPEDLISEAELTHVLTVTDDRSDPRQATRRQQRRGDTSISSWQICQAKICSPSSLRRSSSSTVRAWRVAASSCTATMVLAAVAP
jgi:hypothetical protein